MINREQFISNSLLTTKIFLNAAAFLRIPNDHTVEPANSKGRSNQEDVPDPLDDTRIHPEDYDLARKMATDALELDEEDIHGEHPSHVVALIMADKDNERKLNELSLDEFAVSMFEANGDRKRHTLNVIREEMLQPFVEKRVPFHPMLSRDIMTMLSGESEKTLRRGLIVSVQVMRISKTHINVKFDSGIEGVINATLYSDAGEREVDEIVKKNQQVQAAVFEVKADADHDTFFVELSLRPMDVGPGDSAFRRVKPDPDYWNDHQYKRDSDLQLRKKRAEMDSSRRVIKHPNFHNFNSSQAEAYLDRQQPGDVVIRPSSKGPEYLAVTWKVDDRLYQHIGLSLSINIVYLTLMLSWQLLLRLTPRRAQCFKLTLNTYTVIWMN